MPTIPFIASPTLLVIGLVVFVVGWMMRSWAGRHDLQGVVTGAAASAAWQAVKKGSAPSVPQDLAQRYSEVASETSNTGKAKKVAGMAVRHAMAQVVGIAGLLALIAGVVLVGLGIFWK
jgi:hypothetical protein